MRNASCCSSVPPATRVGVELGVRVLGVWRVRFGAFGFGGSSGGASEDETEQEHEQRELLLYLSACAWPLGFGG